MKVLAFILLAVFSSEACFPVAKNYKFKCAAPNGKGLQDVFEEVPKLMNEFALKLEGMVPASVSHINHLAPTNAVSSLKNESAYKNFKAFMCENMYVDAEFYVNRFGIGVWSIDNKHPFSSNMKLPEREKYRQEYANFADYIRQSTLGKGLDELLREAKSWDRYARAAMVYLNSSKFKTIKENLWVLPGLKEFRDKLRYYNINEDDVIYVYTIFTLSAWSRKK